MLLVPLLDVTLCKYNWQLCNKVYVITGKYIYQWITHDIRNLIVWEKKS